MYVFNTLTALVIQVKLVSYAFQSNIYKKKININ